MAAQHEVVCTDLRATNHIKRLNTRTSVTMQNSKIKTFAEKGTVKNYYFYQFNSNYYSMYSFAIELWCKHNHNYSMSGSC